MNTYVDVIARKRGKEEIIASVMAEVIEKGEYRLNRFWDSPLCCELILVDGDGRHRITAIDDQSQDGKVVVSTILETEETPYPEAI